VLHECDGMEAPFPRVAAPARRVCEACKRGFRYLLFGHNLPVNNLHAIGGPPVPTLDMILDEDLRPGAEIRWTRKAKTYAYTHGAEDVGPAREPIASRCVSAGLSPLTRQSAGSRLTVVKPVD
jgi:hypothetical protein